MSEVQHLPVRGATEQDVAATLAEFARSIPRVDRHTLERIVTHLRALSPEPAACYATHPQQEIDGIIARWRTQHREVRA